MSALLANQAIDLAIAGVISSFAVLIASVAGYIQLRGQSIRQGEKLQAVKEQVQQQQVGSVPTPTLVVAGSGADARPLLATDPVAQRGGVTVGAGPNTTGDVDCGLACVVSEIENVKRTWSADELLRLRYFGAVDRRLTTASDLVGLLRANDIPAHERNVDAATARVEIVRNWQAGRSSIVLGDWITPGCAHWMRFLGDDGGAEFMDPWLGAERRIPWERFAQLYEGWYVHVDAAPGVPLCMAAAAASV